MSQWKECHSKAITVHIYLFTQWVILMWFQCLYNLHNMNKTAGKVYKFQSLIREVHLSAVWLNVKIQHHTQWISKISRNICRFVSSWHMSQVSFMKFLQESTIHGIRYFVDGENLLHKIVWVIIVGFSVAILSYLIYDASV